MKNQANTKIQTKVEYKRNGHQPPIIIKFTDVSVAISALFFLSGSMCYAS